MSFAQSSVFPRPLDPRIERFAGYFHEDRRSTRIAAGQFDLTLDPALIFYLQRNRLPETFFFWELLRSLAFLEAVPEVGTLRWSPLTLADTYEGRVIGQSQGFRLINGWDSLATLADRLRAGGNYMFEARPSDRRTIQSVGGVAKAAFSGEMAQASCYRSYAPWSDWFFDDGCDCTLAMFDHRTGQATIILLSDYT